MTIIENIDPITNEVTEHVIIEREDGSFISMPKSVHEAQQAEISE